MSGKIAVTVLIVLIPFASVLVCLSFRWIAVRTGDTNRLQAAVMLPPGIIRHSIDNLPMGMMFYRADGRVLLKNRMMDALSEKLAGQALINGTRFLNGLLTRDFGSSVTVRGTEDSFLVIGEEQVYSFRREAVRVNGLTLFQLTAYDTTGLYRNEQELKERLAALREAGERIAQDADKAALLAKNEELLSTKARIHDMVGQVLLSARYYLTEDRADIDAADVFAQMAHAMDELLTSGEAVPEKPSQKNTEAKRLADSERSRALKKSLTDAARAMGLQLTVTGETPADSARIMRILTAGARVCMTNAVRHAMAENMVIETASDDSAHIRIRFANDGRVPADFTEGGGLASLRKQAEDAGGKLYYETDPRLLPAGCGFAVTVLVPRGGEDGTQYGRNG